MSALQVEPKTEEEFGLVLGSEVAGMKSGKVCNAETPEIPQLVRTIIESMNRGHSSADGVVCDEPGNPASSNRDTKSEILNSSLEEISDDHLPAVQVELDAIVKVTEKAANSIMDAAEQIENASENVGGEAAAGIVNATTQIYEACGFQNITGQRVTKIVTALREIENKMDIPIAAFGDDDEAVREERRRAGKKRRDEKRQEAIAEGELLEGPQLPEAAASQDDIDSLFDSL